MIPEKEFIRNRSGVLVSSNKKGLREARAIKAEHTKRQESLDEIPRLKEKIAGLESDIKEILSILTNRAK